MAVTGLMIAFIAFADWEVGLDISLGIMYILPMVIAAIVLSPRSILVLALICTIVRGLFNIPHSLLENALGFGFGLLAYASAGLFVVAVMRSRQEQALRIQAETQLKTLVESSPAAILTLDASGVVLAANNAANGCFGLEAGQTMRGKNIDKYLPVLGDALRLDTGIAPFRTSAQSQGRKENGEIFLADAWFSTYPSVEGIRLAAIVIDSSEEMRDREEQNLRQLSVNSRIMAGAMLHEARNLCAAIAAVYSNLTDKLLTGRNDELQGLDHLVKGLARIASLELHPKQTESLETVLLIDVLNDLRIIIEPSWAETGGTTRWELPEEMPRVRADRHGLLQVFLNLAQNSERAVQQCVDRELVVNVTTSNESAFVRFRDSGRGVSDPERLFQPFQSGVSSVGLGLYISRSLLRSYGGELRFELPARGACFVVELLRVVHRSTG